MLDAYGDSYKKFEFIKQHQRSVEGLTIMDVAQRILPKMGDEYRAVEVAVYFKNWISKPEHLFAILSSIHDGYRVVDAIKKLYDKAHLSKADVIKLLGYTADNYRKLEIIKFFASSFGSSDLPDILCRFQEDSRKMEVVKLLHNKGTLYMDAIIRMAGSMSNDEGRIQLATYFASSFTSSSAPYFLQMLSALSTAEGKVRLVQKVPGSLFGLSSPYTALLPEVSGDEHRMSMLRCLLKVPSIAPPQADVIIPLFTSEESKEQALRRIPLGTSCNTAAFLNQLMEHFHSPGLRLKIFKRKITETAVPSSNLIRSLVCLDAGSEREKAFIFFVKSTARLFGDDLEHGLGLCDRESRTKLLSLYRSQHELDVQEVAQLVPLLPVCKKTLQFFRQYNYYDTLKDMLQGPEWTALQAAATESETGVPINLDEDDDGDESESSSEEEEEEEDEEEKMDQELANKGIFIDRATHIMTIDIQAIKKKMDSNVRSYVDMLWKDQEIQYHMKKKRILNNSHTCGCIIVNGVDVIKESQNEVSKMARGILKKEEKRKQKRKELLQKQQKLKVPHSWKDVKATDTSPDEEVCMICMSHLRRVILIPCGHYHTCAHCTRCILRAPNSKNECPLCKQEFTAVNPVFA